MGWKIAALMISSFAMGSILTDFHNLKVHAAHETHIAKLEGLINSYQKLPDLAELRRKLDVAKVTALMTEPHKNAVELCELVQKDVIAVVAGFDPCAEQQVKEQSK